MRRRRNKEVIAGRVNANGTIAAGDEFTIAKGGTGAYVLYLPNGFRLVSLVVTPHNAANTQFYTGIGTISQAIQGITFANAAQDAGFCFVAVGYQT